MDKEEQLRIRRIICNVLKKNLLDHPTLRQAYGDDTAFKREFINSVSCSIAYYLLKGACVIAPEFNYHYVEFKCEQYPSPEALYYNKFALDPCAPATIDAIADILADAFYDERANLIGAAQNVIAKIKTA